MEERWILPTLLGQRIETPGCDFGPKGLTFEFRRGKYIIAKNGGYRGFLSRGAQVFYPATWIVGKIIGKGSTRGKGLKCGVNVEQVCAMLVSPDRSASFQRAVKVCQHPETAGFWKDCCALCSECRGEHRYGTDCTHDRSYEPLKNHGVKFQKK